MVVIKKAVIPSAPFSFLPKELFVTHLNTDPIHRTVVGLRADDAHFPKGVTPEFLVDGLDLVISVLIEVVIGFYALRAIGVILLTHHILQALRVRDAREHGGDAVISVAQFAVSGFEMH
ncbi:uncharacterized protein HPMKF8_1199 [Helicobacter pylori]|nr:uncharacterized protein HPMKF8_1199 [Helicobacter pylori]